MDWQPQHALEIVAGTPPGGGLDRTARALAMPIAAHGLARAGVHVKNIPGEGARKAWAYMDTVRGDPHVVSISHGNMTTDYLLGTRSTDHGAYTPIAMLYTEYIAFMTAAASELDTAAALLERCRDAATLRVALSTSQGNPNHIAVAKVVRHAGGEARALHIRVFDSALDAVEDVVAGRSDVAAVTAASVLDAVGSGRGKIVALSAPERVQGVFGDSPTWRELGVDCVIGAWRGITGAAGLEPRYVAYWEDLVRAVRQTSEWRASLARHAWTDSCVIGEALARHLAAEREDLAAELNALGLMQPKGQSN